MTRLLSFLAISLLIFLVPLDLTFAAQTDINVRDTSQITISGNAENDNLLTFMSPILNYFYSFSPSGDSTVPNIFLAIAWGIKNFFIIVAVLFLIIGVLKLLFSGGDEEAQKKWKNNIIYVSIGVFIMQIAYSFWSTLYLNSDTSYIDGRLAWTFWINIFEPIVNIMLLLASFGFIAMAVYSFYTIITGGGDEEKLKKGKNIIIYALIGFLLIRIPRMLVIALYGEPVAACKNNVWLAVWTCEIGAKNLWNGINIFWKILTYVNGFLALFAVIMILYAGWLILISGWEEEKLKKAKKTILFIVIGMVLLVASQAIFRFFFLKG
jgi:Type IV secretion system pilin